MPFYLSSAEGGGTCPCERERDSGGSTLAREEPSLGEDRICGETKAVIFSVVCVACTSEVAGSTVSVVSVGTSVAGSTVSSVVSVGAASAVLVGVGCAVSAGGGFVVSVGVGSTVVSVGAGSEGLGGTAVVGAGASDGIDTSAGTSVTSFIFGSFGVGGAVTIEEDNCKTAAESTGGGDVGKGGDLTSVGCAGVGVGAGAGVAVTAVLEDEAKEDWEGVGNAFLWERGLGVPRTLRDDDL
jgi:hypothetical protein